MRGEGFVCPCPPSGSDNVQKCVVQCGGQEENFMSANKPEFLLSTLGRGNRSKVRIGNIQNQLWSTFVRFRSVRVMWRRDLLRHSTPHPQHYGSQKKKKKETDPEERTAWSEDTEGLLGPPKAI